MEHTTINSFGDFLKPGIYQFHSGFDHIDNFVNQQGEFVSLAADISFLAPNSIIINDFISSKYTTIIIDNDFILINNQKLILVKELQYNSVFEYPEITYPMLENKINLFINLYASEFPQKSLFFLLYATNKQYFTSAFEKAFMQQMAFAFSLFQSQLCESIKAFKSRGGGLTPSGDDFIAGVLFGIDFLEKLYEKDFSNLKTDIYNISKGLSTGQASNNLFSNNMLRLSYHAKYFKRLQDFLNAFFYLPLNDVNPAFKQLIAVGDTSGADLLTGFLAVILKNEGFVN